MTDHMDSVTGLEERHRHGAMEDQGGKRPELAELVSGLREQGRENGGEGGSLECHSREFGL